MKFKNFQIRWNEALGPEECPYLYRWVFVFFGYSIRVHHWIRSDDKRHFHDHPFHFVSFIVKGCYYNVTPDGREELKAPAYRIYPAKEYHYVEVPEGGAWSILFCSRVFRKWGFKVKGVKWRPLRYFSKFGHPPCDLQ